MEDSYIAKHWKTTNQINTEKAQFISIKHQYALYIVDITDILWHICVSNTWQSILAKLSMYLSV